MLIGRGLYMLRGGGSVYADWEGSVYAERRVDLCMLIGGWA